MKIKLFPFNKIPRDSNIIIYGMSNIGKNFVRQINNLCYCNIVGCIDKNYDRRDIPEEFAVLAPKAIHDLSYDYVVVAVSKRYKLEIENILVNELSVSKEKIVLLDDNYYFTEHITPERDWIDYYTTAEKDAENQFKTIIKPIFEKYALLNPSFKVMDFACGYGRIAEILKNQYKNLVLCDISEDALHYCQERFKNYPNIGYSKSVIDGLPLDSESLDFIYSWDAMVHFSYKFLDIYIGEFARILKSGGFCFIHHSNLADCPECSEYDISEHFYENVHWRSHVSMKDIARIAKNNGFETIEQIPLDWDVKSLDAITILKKR